MRVHNTEYNVLHMQKDTDCGCYTAKVYYSQSQVIILQNMSTRIVLDSHPSIRNYVIAV